ARPRNQLAVLGRVCAGTLRSPVMLNRFPEQVFVDRAENFIGQIELAHFLAAQTVNIYGCHVLCPCGAAALARVFPSHQLPSANYPFLAARFAAFNGSTVAAPANPRRSRGGFFALLMIRYPPLGPGTLPSTTSRFSSLSTPRMRRLRMVTRSVPMCPDMRMPLNTRDGNAEEPIEPVI